MTWSAALRRSAGRRRAPSTFDHLRYIVPLAAAATIALVFGAMRLQEPAVEAVADNDVPAETATGSSLPTTPVAAQAVAWNMFLDGLAQRHLQPPALETFDPKGVEEYAPHIGVRVSSPAMRDAQWVGARLETNAALMRFMRNRKPVTVFVFDPRRVHMQATPALRRRMIDREPVLAGKVRGVAVAASEQNGVGYALATEHYGELRLNRVVLVSDGGANVGVTAPELIANHSNDADGEGIYLVGVGTGPYTQYADGLMDVVTDAGRGAYVYLDSVAEAETMFTERFDEVMEVAARGVNLELTLPWYFQMHEFFGEEYSEDPKEVEAQHLAPSDVMVFNQVLKACDASVVNEADEIGIKATWETPITREPMVLEHVASVGELLNGETAQLRLGKAIVAYAEALKTGTTADIASAQAALSAVDPALGGDVVEEIASLLAKHPKAP